MEINRQELCLFRFLNQGGPRSISPFCSFHCYTRDYLQAGYSDMLDISYLLKKHSQVY